MASGFGKNPLFKTADRRVREAAKQAFRRSDFGRLLSQFEEAHKRPAAAPRDLGKLIRALEEGGSRRLLEEVRRSDAGRLARDLERYARRGRLGKKIVGQVLEAMGPAGKFLQALSGVPGPNGKPSSRARSLEAAIGLLRTFGYEILRRRGLPQSPEELQRSLDAARRFLEEHGQATPVSLPDAVSPPPTIESQQPAEQKATVDVPMFSGAVRRFPKNHPIVTGAMVPCTSSNVHSYGYDVQSWLLYVRFLAPGDGEHKSSSPGPLYQYSHVPPEVFLQFLKAGSKGGFVWDRLRIRGTVSGHQFDYRLVGISNGYVPRKATLRPEGEWFLKRRVRSDQGRGLVSSRPNELVRRLVAVSDGAPNRGRPDRGGPNRGKP